MRKGAEEGGREGGGKGRGKETATEIVMNTTTYIFAPPFIEKICQSLTALV